MRLITLLLLTGLVFQGNAQGLEEKFRDPPATAKPRTWFHVMCGNMSKAGLTKDLEAIADAGIGGIILFNVTHLIPKGEVLFNSPEHIELIAHTAAECERLGLSFGVHNCDGWQTSGGPWITPQYSMKQVVHRELIVQGGKIDVQLPTPSAREGYYQDVAVLAYPSLSSEMADFAHKPTVTASDPDFNIELATDGKIDVKTLLNGSVNRKAWVQFDYGEAHTIRSVYMNLEKVVADKGRTELLTSDDGLNFKEARPLEVLRLGKREHGFDDCFEGITARYFRIETEATFEITEINLSATYRMGDMLARTSLFKIEDHRMPDIGRPEEAMVLKKEDIIDLTASMNSQGRLVTKLPRGSWTIMRFGYTVTGAKNSPASDEGRGLEADKMSKDALNIHFNHYVRNVIEASRPVAPHALQYLEIDSYETGGQNWTQGYEKLFKEKYNYDLVPFLPLYAGRYIDDPETSDEVLWDIRNLNAELIANNYFDHFTTLCHQEDLISYAEPYSFNGPFNELRASRSIDIPMGEFWMHQRYQTGTAASGARIYGKNIVSAESFSARSEINWKGHPGSMKLTGDRAWTLGINEFMFHRYAHQANTHVLPGMTMSMFGSHIDRTQTWWNHAGKAWFRYLARGQYLLRQGIPVSDLLIFVGDGSPNSIVQRESFSPEIPNYLNFDCINSDALINRVSVENGKLVLPNGIQYHALALFNTKRLSLPTLQKINELANQGVLILGDKPDEIGGYASSEDERGIFNEMSHSIWGKASTYSSFEWKEVFLENNIPIDLWVEGREDISYIHRQMPEMDIYFFFNPDSVRQTFECSFKVEGRIPEWWDPMSGETRKIAQFRSERGRTQVPLNLEAEGSGFVLFREPASEVDQVISQSSPLNASNDLYFNDKNEVMLNASENAVYSLHFRSGKTRQKVVSDIPEPKEIKGPWEVHFKADYGYDSSLVFSELIDWKDSELEQVKYYSGTASYVTSFKLGKDAIQADRKLHLELGHVSNAARVILNGVDLGVLWKAPYVVDISDELIEGENHLRLEVTNAWTNRLIGDELYPNKSGYSLDRQKMPEWYTRNQERPSSSRKTFCTYPFYQNGDPLLPSGLLGPVRILSSKIVHMSGH